MFTLHLHKQTNTIIMNQFTPTAQDEALDNFRQAFNMPLINARVSEDGRQMRIRVNLDRLAARYLLHANHVITANALPLTAAIEEWVVKGVLFGRWIVISFDHSKESLPCY